MHYACLASRGMGAPSRLGRAPWCARDELGACADKATGAHPPPSFRGQAPNPSLGEGVRRCEGVDPGEGRGFLKGDGSRRPPSPCLPHPLAAIHRPDNTSFQAESLPCKGGQWVRWSMFPEPAGGAADQKGAA